MNLLSHALLSPRKPGTLVGNLVADWVKGRARLALPEELRVGMALHRRIDAFTDTHALVDRCAGLLSPRWGRYSTVLVDIFFDHCLSVDWSRYCEVPRVEFIAFVYATLREYLPALPARAQYAVRALLADDWFGNYLTLDGIALSLARLSARLRHDIDLAPAVDDFHTHRQAFHDAYAEFIPAIRRHLAGDLIPPQSPLMVTLKI